MIMMQHTIKKIFLISNLKLSRNTKKLISMFNSSYLSSWWNINRLMLLILWPETFTIDLKLSIRDTSITWIPWFSIITLELENLKTNLLRSEINCTMPTELPAWDMMIWDRLHSSIFYSETTFNSITTRQPNTSSKKSPSQTPSPIMSIVGSSTTREKSRPSSKSTLSHFTD